MVSRHALTGLVAAVALLLALAPSPVAEDTRASAAAVQPRGGQGGGPNIIFFLADDMSTAHLRHMPRTRRLIFDQGARFTDYYANVGLCCPARASLMTGKYAHNTGILGNSYPDGFWGFHRGDERRRTVALALRGRGGYDTSLLGKYLNEYPIVESSRRHGVRPTYVPPGWSDWAVPVRGQFAGTDYRINLNGRILHKRAPRDYLGDFLVRRAIDRIRANRDDSGIAMTLSFYGPHVPAPASPVEKRDRRLNRRISRIHYPRTPAFDEADVRDKPRHIRRLPRLSPTDKSGIDRAFRRQLLSLASIDRYVGMVVSALRRTGQLRSTYLVFSSDHGYHLGEHRLVAGKNAPYLTDLRVPLGIRGPGIEPGSEVREVAGTIDVAPTFADMAGIRLPYRHDGESLLPLAQGETPEWRRWFLVRRGHIVGGEVGRAGLEPTGRLERTSGTGIPGWRGVVSRRWQYVRFVTGEVELYDARRDPHQLRNVAAIAPRRRTDAQQTALRRARRAVRALTGCSGVAGCRR